MTECRLDQASAATKASLRSRSWRGPKGRPVGTSNADKSSCHAQQAPCRTSENSVKAKFSTAPTRWDQDCRRVTPSRGYYVSYPGGVGGHHPGAVDGTLEGTRRGRGARGARPDHHFGDQRLAAGLGRRPSEGVSEGGVKPAQPRPGTPCVRVRGGTGICGSVSGGGVCARDSCI